jgi:hypothetical protein
MFKNLKNVKEYEKNVKEFEKFETIRENVKRI